MKLSKWAILLFSAVFLFGFIGTAGATMIPVELEIDFREESKWLSARGKDSLTQTIGGVPVQAETDSGYYKKKFWWSKEWVYDELTWKRGHGLGISGHSDDYSKNKVNGSEVFEIDFYEEGGFGSGDPANYAVLWLTGFTGPVSRLKNPDIFEIELQKEEEGVDTIDHILDLEKRVTLYSNGVVYINLLDENFPEFNEIDIQLNDPDGLIKFWVAGVGNEPVPTPEPATMLLLGTGLLGLAGFGRKKMLKKNKG